MSTFTPTRMQKPALHWYDYANPVRISSPSSPWGASPCSARLSKGLSLLLKMNLLKFGVSGSLIEKTKRQFNTYVLQSLQLDLYNKVSILSSVNR